MLAAVVVAGIGHVGVDPVVAAPADVTELAPPAGLVSGGTGVTITGRGFTGATAVRFGDQDALEFRLDSDTDDLDRITAFSPPWVAATERVVKVQVLVGGGSAAEGSFTYFDGGFAQTAPMTARRRGQGATLLNDGTVLLDTSSLQAYGDPRISEVFVPGGPGRPPSWRPTGTPVAPDRTEHTSTTLPDGRVLVAGGALFPGEPSAEIYEPSASASYLGTPVRGAWSPAPAMSSSRRGHGAALLSNGKVLVVGGQGDSGALLSAEVFDPNRNTWGPTGRLGESRIDHSTTLLADGRVLVAGGRDGKGSTRSSSEIYDLKTGRWTPTKGPLATARSGHRAAVLADGRVLVVGGRDADGKALRSAETFDPVTERWTPVGSLAVARFGHTATLLGDGRVLVAGGQPVDGPLEPDLASAEVYDPTRNTWGSTSSLISARTGHTATLLPSGLVLVAGGAQTVGVGNAAGTERLMSAELFDPSFAPAPSVVRLDPPGGREAGGTEVHIYGSFLYGGHRSGDPPAYTNVRFGEDPPARVRAVSERELIAVSPPGKGIADVRVTTDLGTSPKIGATQFIYGRGAFGPAASCADGEACQGRADQTSVVLDPPACHTASPPPAYPCGKVLVAGMSSRVFEGQLLGDILTSDAAGFAQGDELRDFALSGLSFPYSVNRIVKVIDARTVQLSRSSPYPSPHGVRFGFPTTSGQIYDPRSGAWSPVAAMGHRSDNFLPLPKVTFTSTLLPDGRVLVAGGCCEPTQLLATATLYDPVSDRWTPTASPMATARIGHTATLLDGPACHAAGPPPGCGKVLIAGGLTSINEGSSPRNITPTAELFDPASATFSPAASMGEIRAVHTATRLPDGDVLVVGGAGSLEVGMAQPDEAPLFSAERYDLATGTWKATPDLPAQQRTILHTATLLDPPACAAGRAPAGYPCGSVLVAGGATDFKASFYGASDGRTSVKLYDPLTDGWTPVLGLSLGRTGHTATLLPDGSLLVAGGSSHAQSGEIYDPATRTSRLTLPLSAERTDHTATLLDAQPCGTRCGQVLVTGGRIPAYYPGFIFGEHLLDSSELFTPAPYSGEVNPGRGTSAGNTSVVLDGSALLDVTGVTFGGVPAASFTVDSATRITAVTPHHPAGTVEVGLSSPLWPNGSELPARAPPFTFIRSKPAAPADLSARSLSATAVEVAFTAVGSDADNPPPATRYQVRQATTPITDDATFAAATDLCPQACAFSPPTIGTPLLLTVSNLAPATTYHYAVKALDPTGIAGGLSNPASATTPAQPPSPTPPTTAAPRPPVTTAPRSAPQVAAPRPAAPRVTTRTGTPPPATPRLVASPVAHPAAVVLPSLPLPPLALAARPPPAAAPRVLFTPAQQADPSGLTRTRRVIPKWILVLTAISVIVNLAVLGGYLNRRLRR